MEILDPVRRFLESEPGNLVDGEFVPTQTMGRFDVTNPANGDVLTSVPDSTSTDIDAAVGAARRAFPGWAALAPNERARLLWRLADLIEEHKLELGQLDVLDNGKTLTDWLAVDLPLTVDLFRYYAGWATKIEGRQVSVSAPNLHVYTRREPLGVVGAIVPWNFPLLMCAYKLGPALAAGNTVVLKPAEQTPLSALRLGELVVEAGLPPGVVNIVCGFGVPAGAPLAAHTDVDKVSFTGDYNTGRLIVGASTSNLKRLTLELGGKSPNIVFDDADLDRAVAGAFGGVFFNQGQCCVAGSRLFVHEAVHEQLVDRLVTKAEGIRLGNGLDSDTEMGPVVSAEQRQRVEGFVAEARRSGATIRGGGPVDDSLSGGHFVTPAVVFGAEPNDRIMQEEVFGPVLAVSSFNDEDEVVALANDVQFGLAAGVWTTDVGRAHRMAAKLQAGTVWVNTYGNFDAAASYGGFKMSGYGRENGEEALDAYLQSKTVWVDLT